MDKVWGMGRDSFSEMIEISYILSRSALKAPVGRSVGGGVG